MQDKSHTTSILRTCHNLYGLNAEGICVDLADVVYGVPWGVEALQPKDDHISAVVCEDR